MLTLSATGNRNNQTRLDASESIWFRDQLRVVAEKMYDEVFESNLSRKYIPPSDMQIAEWAKVVLMGQLTQFGEAKIVASMSDDLPRVDVAGIETPLIIKLIGDAYGYDVMEIRASMAQGTDLPLKKAVAARRAIETKIDKLLALGDTETGINGILKLDTVGSITPVVGTTKTGGGVPWTPAALPLEIANDIFRLISGTIARQNGAGTGDVMFQRFRILMPDANYLRLAQTGMNDTTGRTILEFLLKDPYIESIAPWHRAVGAGPGGVDRIIAFAPNPSVVSAIVPMEFTPQEQQQRNLEYVTACIASCGGVNLQFAPAVGYLDNIQAT